MRVRQPGANDIDFAAELKAAQHVLYDLPFEDGFLSYAAEREISPEDTERPAYWNAFADYAALHSDRSTPHGILGLIVASTPSVIYANDLLNAPAYVSRDEYREAKRRVSENNHHIRYAAEKLPGLPLNPLGHTMLNAVTMSVENPDLVTNSPEYIRAILRGARHEFCFGQLLRATERNFQPANPQQDRRGIDYTVATCDGQGTLQLDVKASKSKLLRANAKGDPFVVDPRNNSVKIHSHLRDNEFTESFALKRGVSGSKAPRLEELLEKIEEIILPGIGHVAIQN